MIEIEYKAVEVLRRTFNTRLVHNLGWQYQYCLAELKMWLCSVRDGGVVPGFALPVTLT
jgi:hypothetical protein